FKPAAVGGIAVDHPRRAGCVGVIQHDLKAMVLIVVISVGAVAEETRRDIVLTNPVRHADKDSVLRVLLPINAPIKLIVVCPAGSLREVIIEVIQTLT